MLFIVPVLEVQHPCSDCLAVPNPGDIGLDPDGLVLEIWPLLEERDGHSLGYISDVDLVLDIPRDRVHAIPVEMGLGFSPDGVWDGHRDSGVPCLALMGQW